MATMKSSELLNNPEVMREIERYKWIESEKQCRDIGAANAATEWLNKYSEQWLKLNQPAMKPVRKSAKRV